MPGCMLVKSRRLFVMTVISMAYYSILRGVACADNLEGVLTIAIELVQCSADRKDPSLMQTISC
jgi:hypothetical protein